MSPELVIPTHFHWFFFHSQYFQKSALISHSSHEVIAYFSGGNLGFIQSIDVKLFLGSGCKGGVSAKYDCFGNPGKMCPDSLLHVSTLKRSSRTYYR